MSDDAHNRAFQLARGHGTPLLLFSAARLNDAVARFDSFARLLPFPVEKYYSYKTNYLPSLCKQLAACGYGAEVTSPLEWRLARSLYDPSSIVINGVGKEAGLLDMVLNGPAPRLINVETDTEVDRLLSPEGSGVPLDVGIRVHIPGVTGERGSDPSEGWRRGTGKFGWSISGSQFRQVVRALSSGRNTTLEALHLHIGGQLVSSSLYRVVLKRLSVVLEQLAAEGIFLPTLDLGGGLASGWVEKRRSGPLFQLLQSVGLPPPTRSQQYPELEGIAEAMSEYGPRLRAAGVERILLEPGRFLAEPAMIAVGSVIAIRHDGARSCAVLDVGTNVLRCCRFDERRCVSFEGYQGRRPTRYELVGPLCHRGDTLGLFDVPGELTPGTLVCIDAVGAYSHGDWVANAWLRPPVLSLENESVLWTQQRPVDFWSPACGLWRTSDVQ